MHQLLLIEVLAVNDLGLCIHDGWRTLGNFLTEQGKAVTVGAIKVERIEALFIHEQLLFQTKRWRDKCISRCGGTRLTYIRQKRQQYILLVIL